MGIHVTMSPTTLHMVPYGKFMAIRVNSYDSTWLQQPIPGPRWEVVPESAEQPIGFECQGIEPSGDLPSSARLRSHGHLLSKWPLESFCAFA